MCTAAHGVDAFGADILEEHVGRASLTLALIDKKMVAAAKRRGPGITAAVHKLLLSKFRRKSLVGRLGEDAVTQSDVEAAGAFHSGARSVVDLKTAEGVVGLVSLSPLGRRRICPGVRKGLGVATGKNVDMLPHHDGTKLLQLLVRLGT